MDETRKNELLDMNMDPSTFALVIEELADEYGLRETLLKLAERILDGCSAAEELAEEEIKRNRRYVYEALLNGLPDIEEDLLDPPYTEN